MARLLIVHHTPSPTLHALCERVVAGARDPQIAELGGGPVDVVLRPALTATAVDVLEADGYVVGTPANLGYISGALKHFFDTIYYPCLEATVGRPFGYYLHGNDDTAGARKAIEKITTGLRWRLAAAPVEVTGTPDRTAFDACTELGGTLAATLVAGL